MPRPVGRETAYHPGLDGIRAIAVAVVFMYHLGWSWAPGGLLGVGVFFTLSGYLITTILLNTWDRRGNLDLRHFWLRRARRLLPAVVLVVVVVLAATLLVAREELGSRAVFSLAALFYVANWVTIATGNSYFDQFAGPGPFDHLWSLSIEEQFYLVWPLLLLLLLWMFRGKLAAVATATVLMATASFVIMWVVAAPGFDNTRAYEGTDTRAGALLVGAAVAMFWRPHRLRRTLEWRARVALDGAGLFALGVIAGMVMWTNQLSLTLYRGGILALSLATVVLVAVAVHPTSVLGRVLGLQPLRWIGERSYGIYLWHLPVIVFLPASVLADRPWWRAALLVGITLLLSALSWALVEDPIRRHGLLAALRLQRPRSERPEAPAAPLPPSAPEDRAGLARPAPARLRGPALVPGALAVVLVATASLTVASFVGPQSPAAAGEGQQILPVPVPTSTPTSVPPTTATTAPPTTAPVTVPPTTGAPTTSAARTYDTECERVVHVGDSTSLGQIDPALDASKHIDAQYEAVGVEDVDLDILGARSIVETYHGEPNAQEAVQSRLSAGYDGCWVIAMGINEVANQVVGGVFPLDERIELVMDRIPVDQPVLWLSVKTLVSLDSCTSLCAWAQERMPEFNEALAAACERYPNMRVYDWAAQAPDSWYGPDRIHYTYEGSTERANRTARALAMAFPEHGPQPTSCFITPP